MIIRSRERADAVQADVTVDAEPVERRQSQLVQVGDHRAMTLQSAERPRANLVFLIDVSGSMYEPQDQAAAASRTPCGCCVDELKPEDTVSIVTYARAAGIALEPTNVADKAKILAAIDALGAGGSTAGARRHSGTPIAGGAAISTGRRSIA